MKNRIRYDELFQPETAIYQRSYFTKKLELDIDNIEIYNIFNLYKINKGYYIAFVNEYMLFNDCVDGSITIKIRKGNFILQKKEPIKCLAELLFIVIDFYNIIKNKLIQNIEGLDVEGQILTQRQRKDKYILEDILNYHIINRFIIRFDYDIDNKSAYPILLCY
jgi:hypothetical protein